VTYVACSPVADPVVRVAAPEELVEVRWAEPDEVEALIPDLYEPVRDYLAQSVTERGH